MTVTVSVSVSVAVRWLSSRSIYISSYMNRFESVGLFVVKLYYRLFCFLSYRLLASQSVGD